MTKTHVILSLLVATLVMQAAILMRQSGRLSGKPAKEDYFVVPATASLDIAGMPFLGSPQAAIALVEFSDFECPFCQRHARAVLPTLKEQFVVSGILRYVFANLPLSIHANAIPLAKAAGCAGKQGKYWEMHEGLFGIPMPAFATKGDIDRLAQGLVLDQTKFAECYGGSEVREQIAMDLPKAEMLGIKTTPTFVIGRLAPDGLLRPKAVIHGSRPFSVFEEVIRKVQVMQD